ncbi:hypothetical protein FM036_44740 [Nostoc sp. HG1]|nr:hypothetical protein [Nostoc sp. HG1]
MLRSLGKKRLILCLMMAALLGLFAVWWNLPTQRRSGLYQFAYEENSAGNMTVKQPQFIELLADGRWLMYRVPSRYSEMRPRELIAPLEGTYKIDGDTITFVRQS